MLKKLTKQKGKFLKFYLVLFLFNFFYTNANDEVLYVYSSSSFARMWKSPKSNFNGDFEKLCKCKVKFISLDSGSSLITKLLLEGKKSKADLVVGLSDHLIVNAIKSGVFYDLSNTDLKDKAISKYFVPYEYSYIGFIYNSEVVKQPPKNFGELVSNKDLRIIIQDPRSSLVGLSFINWISLTNNNNSNFLKKLNNNLVTITSKWTESYNLFLRGEANMVLSYNTSELYHFFEENELKYKFAYFEEGHLKYSSLASINKFSKKKELAIKFLGFILSEQFQDYLSRYNYMYPINSKSADNLELYDIVAEPKVEIEFDAVILYKNKHNWIKKWLENS